MADYKFNFIKCDMNYPWWILVHDRHNLIYAKDTCRYCQLHSELNLKKISHYAAGTNSLQLIALYNMLKGDTLHFLINCRKCLSSGIIFRGHKWRSKRLLNTKQLLRWYSSRGTPISNTKVDKTQFIPVFVFFKKLRAISYI